MLVACSLGCTDKGNLKSTGAPQAKGLGSDVGGFRFDDITDRLKLKHRYENGESANELAILETIGGGVAAIDYDMDGFDDLLFASGGKLENKAVTGLGAVLWRSHLGREFRSVTGEAGVVCSNIYTHGTASGDINNDGFPDVLVTGYFGIALFVNQGDGSFQEQSTQAELMDPSWGTSSGFGDFDGDGNLDFYIAHYVDWSFQNHPACKSAGAPDVCAPGIFKGLSDVVWMSNGDGSFSRKTAEIGLISEGKGLGVIIGIFPKILRSTFMWPTIRPTIFSTKTKARLS